MHNLMIILVHSRVLVLVRQKSADYLINIKGPGTHSKSLRSMMYVMQSAPRAMPPVICII